MCSPGGPIPGAAEPAGRPLYTEGGEQVRPGTSHGDLMGMGNLTYDAPQQTAPTPPAQAEALPAEAPMVIEAPQQADVSPKVKKRRTRRKAKSQSQQSSASLAIPLNAGGPGGPGSTSGGVGGNLSIPS